MPEICRLPFPVNCDPSEALVQHGPLIRVEVGSLRTGSRTSVMAIIDTGANEVCVDDGLAIELDLDVRGKQEMWGAQGKSMVDVYAGRLRIPEFSCEYEGLFLGTRIWDGHEKSPRVLLGRWGMRALDLRLSYDGTEGQFSLCRG